MVSLRYFGYLSSSITKVYLKLDDEKAGKNSMLKDPYASKHKVVPIQEVEANIKTNKCSLETFKRTRFPSCMGMLCAQSSRSYTAPNCCFFRVGEAKNFSKFT